MDAQTAIHARKRTAAQRTRDLVVIEQLMLEGKNQSQIAAELSAMRPYSLSRSQIQFDLSELQAGWRESTKELISTARDRQLRRLEKASEAALAEFHASRQAKNPDPRWLRLILETHDRIARLLGLDSATKHELSGPGGGPIPLSAEPLDSDRKAELLRRHLERLENAKRIRESTASGSDDPSN